MTYVIATKLEQFEFQSQIITYRSIHPFPSDYHIAGNFLWSLNLQTANSCVSWEQILAILDFRPYRWEQIFAYHELLIVSQNY